MSISHDRGTLIAGKSFSQNLHPKMSVNIENTIDTSKVRYAEKTDKTITGVSYLIGKRIRAKLEPLNAEISTRTQLLNQLMHENSAGTTSTVASRTNRPATEPPAQ